MNEIKNLSKDILTALLNFGHDTGRGWAGDMKQEMKNWSDEDLMNILSFARRIQGLAQLELEPRLEAEMAVLKNRMREEGHG